MILCFKIPFPHALIFPSSISFISDCYTSYYKLCKEIGDGAHSQLTTPCLCCCFHLTFFPCSSIGFFPYEAVLHLFLQCDSFPQAAVLPKQLQHGDSYLVQPLRKIFTSMSPHHGIPEPARKPAPACTPLCLSCSTLLQHELTTESQLSAGYCYNPLMLAGVVMVH